MTLVVDRLILRQIRVPFRFAFEHARHKRQVADHFIVEVRTADGLRGFGEILPRDYVSGETLASCREDMATFWWPLLATLRIPLEHPPFAALRPLYERADDERRTAGYAGVDVAVFDLWARARQAPLDTLLGGAPQRLPLSAPIGVGMPARILTHAACFAGFDALKVKTGDAGSLARVVAVARAAGGRSLVLDANGQSTTAATLALAASLKAQGINIAAWEEPGGTQSKQLSEAGLVLMADESLVTRADAARLITAGNVRHWNLRLAKNGGFSGLQALCRLAARNGVTIQLGALVGETSCFGAAAFAAAAVINAETGQLPWRCESSFPRWLLRRDPFSGGPSMRRGALIRRGEGAGLGVEPTNLDQVTVETVTFSRSPTRP